MGGINHQTWGGLWHFFTRSTIITITANSTLNCHNNPFSKASSGATSGRDQGAQYARGDVFNKDGYVKQKYWFYQQNGDLTEDEWGYCLSWYLGQETILVSKTLKQLDHIRSNTPNLIMLFHTHPNGDWICLLNQKKHRFTWRLVCLSRQQNNTDWICGIQLNEYCSTH